MYQKGYVVRQAKTDGQYTLTGYRGEHENLANGETHENAGTRAEGTYVISGSADLDKDTHADMFTNANVDLVLEKTDSYNVVKDQWVQRRSWIGNTTLLTKLFQVGNKLTVNGSSLTLKA